MKKKVLFKAGLLHCFVCMVNMDCKPEDSTTNLPPAPVLPTPAPAQPIPAPVLPTPAPAPLNPEPALPKPAPVTPKPAPAPPAPPAPPKPEPKHVHYPIVGIPNTTGAHCWANAVLQVVHALYKEKVYEQGDSPLKSMLLAMDTAIQDKKTVVEFPVLDKFFKELEKNGHFKAYPKNETKDALNFLTELGSHFYFMQNMILCDQYDKNYPAKQQSSVVQYNGFPKRLFNSNKHDTNYDGKIYKYYSTIEGVLPNIVIVNGFRGDLRPFDNLSTVKIDPKFFKDDPGDAVYLSLEAFMVNTGGHWLSYIKKEHQWYCANDHSVSLVTENEFKNLSIVWDVLFYKKQTLAPNGANIPTIPATCEIGGE